MSVIPAVVMEGPVSINKLTAYIGPFELIAYLSGWMQQEVSLTINGNFVFSGSLFVRYGDYEDENKMTEGDLPPVVQLSNFDVLTHLRQFESAGFEIKAEWHLMTEM